LGGLELEEAAKAADGIAAKIIGILIQKDPFSSRGISGYFDPITLLFAGKSGNQILKIKHIALRHASRRHR